jgi:hypothetical protein
MISDNQKEYLLDKVNNFYWKILPQPILDYFKINIDKKYYEFSMGDLLPHVAIGSPLGGWKMGSVFGQGLALYGNAFPIIYFGMCLIIFAVIDLLSKRLANGGVIISSLGQLTIWSTFFVGITADSIAILLTKVLRGIIQEIILYLLIVFLLSLILGLLRPKVKFSY